MNAVSSRSHAIFSVILKQQQSPNISSSDLQGDEETSQNRTLVSKFHFVDLAGSERVSSAVLPAEILTGVG
jgi:hypothetical protein